MNGPLPPWMIPPVVLNDGDGQRDPEKVSGCGCLLFFLSAVLAGAVWALLR